MIKMVVPFLIMIIIIIITAIIRIIKQQPLQSLMIKMIMSLTPILLNNNAAYHFPTLENNYSSKGLRT